MSTRALAVLEEFKRLPLQEQREVSDFILRQLTAIAPPPSRRRTIADIAGKYRAQPDGEAKDHDRGFAEAAAT